MSNMLSISKIYTLVPMQEGMLYNWLLDKSSAAYVQQLLFEVSGSFDTNIMKQCFKALAENHDVLRTNFINEGLTKARQVVFKEREIEICEYDLSSETDENIDERLNQLVYEDKKRGFDLAKSSLMRITIIKLSANKYTIIWSNHHIIMDGWSRSILINEFFQYYSYIKNGLKIPNKNDYDFSDYVKWIEKSNKERSAEYWKKYLDSYEQSAVIPKKSVNSENEYLTGTVEFEINKRDYEKIEKITGECSVTVNTFFQCVWGILLQKYNNTTDVVYGNVVSGRNYGIYGLDKMVGVFINTVPVRIQTTQEDTLLTLIKKVQEQTLESSKYENLTLAEIQSGSSLKQALIDNIIAFENYPLERGIQNLNESNKLGFVIGEVGVVEQIDYDFGVTFIPWNGLKIKMRFNRNVYSEQFVESIAGHLLQLIKLVIDNPNRLIKNLSVLTDEEKDEIIKWGTGNKTSDISHGLLHSLFEKCAESRPDDTAVSCSINFDLLAEKVSQDCIMPGELKKLKQMIFTKNKYIYKYEKSDLLKSIIDECDYNNIRLLRTNTHKLVAVNNTLYCLLDCLDGRCSLESVYNEILNKSLKLKAWKIENNEYGNLEGEEFSCNTNFESFIRLISCLINNNVIEFVGLNKAPCTFNYSEMQVRNEEFTKNCSDNLQINKKGPGVLLIGDTPGPATTGLLYIASYLRRNGIEAYCRWNDTDRRNNNLEKNIRKLLNEVKPDIVGISMKWFLHMARVIEIARIIKEYSKNIKVVIGGNSASFYDVDLIKTGNIDYIVRGDGELPFLKICQNAEYIPNCTYIVDNQIVRNEITYVQNEENSKDIYLSNLDEIFVDKEDIYKAPYFFIFTGKGCSMNCFYCAGCKTVQKQSFNRPKPFMRGIEQVRKDIMAVKPYTGVFMFDFDLPNYDSSGYYEQLWSGLGLKNHFCMFYFWKLPTEEFLEMVSKEFKYVYINIDLASMSERHRKYLTSMRVVKPQPEDAEIFSLFEKCDMYDNIEITINQIAGLPYFTKEDAVISEKVVEQLLSKYKRFKGIDWGRLHAQPGASLSTDASEFDMHSNASEFEDFLKYSRMNLTEVEIYPDLANTYYPFISFNDDSVNSTISKHYIRLNELIEKSSTRNNKLIINDKLTYGELNYKADLLADYLLTHGIGSGDIVALLFPRCIEMMIAVLGVLKSGAAYLPLDPAYPYERLKYIIEDSGASRLISFETHRVSEWFGENTFFMDQINSYTESNPKDAATLVRNTKVSPEDISYIIYTSGTTGRPKGIKISHKSISGTIKWRAREYGLNSTDNVLQLFSYSFDGFLTSMFTPLASGACAVIVTDDDINDPNAISNIIVRHKVSHFISVPALFHTILETMNEHDIMS
ncbi:MAG: AMP-binding protein, partial [Clostridiaceae bacterium]|nr:AMP-binding protein [Clostridiaceae bacterium]